jgi:hypothetical protein
MRAGESEVNPEKIDQQSARLNFALDLLTVDSQANSGHGGTLQRNSRDVSAEPCCWHAGIIGVQPAVSASTQ